MIYRRLTRTLTAVAAAMTLQAALQAKSLGWNADALTVELQEIHRIAPPPEGVAELKFSDFYLTPVGAGGLQMTEKLKGLAEHRVRILGFMVRQTQPVPGLVMITPYAASTHEGEYGLCDDLPPATLFVEVPKYQDIAVPFSPGPLLLTGRLHLGRRDEADGRVSFVRLVLDPETSPTPTAQPTARTAEAQATAGVENLNTPRTH